MKSLINQKGRDRPSSHKKNHGRKSRQTTYSASWYAGICIIQASMLVIWPADENIGAPTITWSRAFSLVWEAALSLLGLMVGSAQRIRDGRRHHKVAEGHLADLCPESMSVVDGATWDRCYIYGLPRYPSLPAPASLCTFRSITAYFFVFVEIAGQNGRRQDELKAKEKSAHDRGEADTQGGSKLWRLVSMNLPGISLSAGLLVMRVDDECHLHCTHTPHKCAPDHSARRWLKSSLRPLLSAGPRLCISGQS